VRFGPHGKTKEEGFSFTVCLHCSFTRAAWYLFTMSDPCSCGAKEVFAIDPVTTPSTEYSNTVDSYAIVSAWIEKQNAGLFSLGGERLSCGLAAKVCVSCARVEWFAKDLALLASFAEKGIGSVRRMAR
jgi:hypothetical protein